MIRPKYQRMKPWNLIGLPLYYIGICLNDIGYYIYVAGDKIIWYKRKQIGYTKRWVIAKQMLNVFIVLKNLN